MLGGLSVRTIAIAGAVLIATVFTALVGLGTARAVHSLVVAGTLERHEEVARQLAADYDDFLVLHRRAMEGVARQAARLPRLDMAGLHALLADVNEVYPALWGIGITDATGRIVAVDPPITSDGKSAIGIDLSDRDWFREMQQTRAPVIGRRLLTGRVKTTPTITVNVPIVDGDGALRGTVTGGLELARVLELAERVRLGNTGRASVASADGVLFAARGEALIGRDVSALPFWSAMTGATAGRIDRYASLVGDDRLAGFATVPSAGWKVWVSQDLAEIQAEVRAAYLSVGGWLLLAFAALLAGAVFVGLAVTRPLQAVQRTAASFAAGQMDERAPEVGPVEIADVARSFNRMADAVRGLVEAERSNRRRLEAALEHYGAFAARIAEGDFERRVQPAGDGKLAELGESLNAMATRLGEQVDAIQRTAAQLREETAALETVNQTSRMLSAQLDLEPLVQGVTDAAARITGAAFGAFFYNVIDAQGERYTLYTLSGAPKEAFARFPMPRNTALFGPTFRGEAVVRIDDVRRDPRYGKSPPYHGPPRGHLPVVSYLAVPVVSRTGEVLGGLFFGHPEVGVFTERHERMVVALAAQAAVAMDNARLYEHEQRAREAAETANRHKDEFLATLSHELRTPLNAMLGWATMLREGKPLDEAGRARAIAAIERNARAQRELIEDLLDISRIVTAKLRLEMTALDLAGPVEAALDAVRPAVAAKGIHLVVELSPVTVAGDAERLQQVAWNLLSNAVKFTPAAGQVTVRVGRVDDHAELVVQDTGQGIAPDVLPHVFDRFRQADSTTTRQHGGLGLGLALVKHLVELHGGTVSVTSAGPDAGAMFTVRLPVGPVIPEEAPRVPARTAFEGRQLDGIRVLLVDDHRDTVELIATMLSGQGAEVTTASDVPTALDAFTAAPPDVLISDIAMPGEDGYMLIKKIRALPASEGGHVPAIALTAHGGRDERLRVLAAGFQLHVVKPADPAEILLAVASLAHGPRG